MLMRFDPFQELARAAAVGTQRQPVSMPMDAYRLGDTVHIYFDVPGVSVDDLDVTVEKHTLRVSAKRSWETTDEMQVLANERSQGEYVRTVQLGDNLDTDAMTASYEDGVLHVTIPVADRAKPRRIEVGRESVTTS